MFIENTYVYFILTTGPDGSLRHKVCDLELLGMTFGANWSMGTSPRVREKRWCTVGGASTSTIPVTQSHSHYVQENSMEGSNVQ